MISYFAVPLVALLAALPLTGCMFFFHLSEVESQEMQSRLSADEIAAYQAHGTSTLKGRVALRVPDGRMINCPWGKFRLVPAIRYVEEMLDIEASGKNPVIHGNQVSLYLEPYVDPRLKGTVHEVSCDALGSFEINRLPAGRWYALIDPPALNAIDPPYNAACPSSQLYLETTAQQTNFVDLRAIPDCDVR